MTARGKDMVYFRRTSCRLQQREEWKGFLSISSKSACCSRWAA